MTEAGLILALVLVTVCVGILWERECREHFPERQGDDTE
jgi:hypothetical protein